MGAWECTLWARHSLREIMRRRESASMGTLAICAIRDSEMERLCTAHDIEVVVIPESAGDMV